MANIIIYRCRSGCGIMKSINSRDLMKFGGARFHGVARILPTLLRFCRIVVVNTIIYRGRSGCGIMKSINLRNLMKFGGAGFHRVARILWVRVLS